MNHDEARQTFTVCFPDVSLSIEDIWPDGDAPVNPTARDVVERMGGSSVGAVIRDWNLVDEIHVLCNRDVSLAVLR